MCMRSSNRNGPDVWCARCQRDCRRRTNRPASLFHSTPRQTQGNTRIFFCFPFESATETVWISHTDRFDAFLQRSKRCGFCPPDLSRTRGSTNYLKTPTLLCFIKSPLTVVMSCISFYRHFRRPHRTIVCVIELISSACRTTQDALWIVTFLLGPCLRTFINSF